MQHYLFCDGRLILTQTGGLPAVVPADAETLPFCLADGVECIAASVDVMPIDCKTIDLRASYDILPLQDYKRAGKAAELIYWHANHRFCSKCGVKMQKTSPISLKCPKCSTEIWPQLSPAIIVLIHRDDKILLVRSRNFKGNYYGLVAGFVELGESLEEALIREIREETQLEVDDIRYFGSQPWPYPLGLMVGFIARYAGGELKLQDEELVEGDWFSINDLPQIPKPLSLARKLIDYFLETYTKRL